MNIALITCAKLPEPDPDERPLLDALRAAGYHADSLAWDREDHDPALADLCLIRATWNYHHHLDEFLAWVDRASTVSRLINPPSVVRWNVDKRYLRALEDAGLPVVPTVWPEVGDRLARASELGWTDVVIKPVVSAGSFLTRRFDLSTPNGVDAARAFLDDELADRPMMVQKYLPSVESVGERSIVWIAGEVTHAIHKHPRFDDADERVEAAPVSPEERAFAQRAASMVRDFAGAEPFYARVDIMRDDTGGLCLAELELVEPSLYFDLGPAGLTRYVEAVGELLAHS